MRHRIVTSTLAGALAFAASAMLFAQAGRGGGAPAAPSPPAPARDLTGVWMMRNPPGKNGPWTNFTYTDPMKNPPSLTAWGEAEFKKARDSNGGNYTLDETNDPVLTKCYPPGVPRVYFHPYPFEVVQTPKQTLLIYEYDHWMRRVHTDGRSHLRGADGRLQREDVARPPRPRSLDRPEGDRTVPPHRSRSPRGRYQD